MPDAIKRFRSVAQQLAIGILALTFASCVGSQAKPSHWVLWYVPNEPQPAGALPNPCNTYVFASSPGQTTYVVAVIKGWVGDNKPAGHSGTMHSGEDFSGPLELGAATIHDDSNGFNLAINVIYAVGTYAPAKARADADCPPPRQSIAPAHARPKQSAKP